MMHSVKEEHSAMWGNKLLTLFLVCGLPFCSFAQKANQQWSFVFAPGVSKSKLPSGVGVGYPDSPFFVNLKIREPYLFAFSAEINRENINSKNWYFSKGLGFSSYSYVIYYDYDREASIGTIRSEQQSFNFIYASYKVGKSVSVNKFRITPYAALSLNYAIRDKLVS